MPPLTGIGLTLQPAAGALRVTAMDPEGPAAKGGLIIPGDLLYEVDDTRCAPGRVAAVLRAHARASVPAAPPLTACAGVVDSIVGLNGEQVRTLILGPPGASAQPQRARQDDPDRVWAWPQARR